MNGTSQPAISDKEKDEGVKIKAVKTNETKAMLMRIEVFLGCSSLSTSADSLRFTYARNPPISNPKKTNIFYFPLVR